MSEQDVKELQRKFTGVVFHKQERKWRARYYKEDGKRTWLKTLFATAQQAARAYDAAVLEDGLPAQPLNFVSPEARIAAEKKRAAPVEAAKAHGSLTDLVQTASKLRTTPAPPAAKPARSPAAGVKRKRPAGGDADAAADAGPSTTTTTTTTAEAAAAAASPPVSKRRAKKKQRRERQRENKRQGEGAEAANVAASKAIERPLIETLRARPVPLAEHAPQKAKSTVTLDAANTDASWTTRRPQPRPKLDASKLSNEVMRDVASLVELTCTQPSWERYYAPLLERFGKEGWIETTARGPDKAKGDEDESDSGGDEDHGAESRLFGLDCEMILCKPKAQIEDENVQPVSVLARVSLVECNPSRAGVSGSKVIFKTLVDEYVQIPDDMQVVDLLTHVSGIEQSHLDAAKFSFAEAQASVVDRVRSLDVVVGHSLWSDFGALRIWHGTVVDTTALCGVRNLPHMTLSLKDAAVAVLSDQRELEQFQESGESHDSVADAQWSIRVMFGLLQLSKTRKVTLPYLFDTIPDRYRARLTFHLLPAGATEAKVADLVRARFPEGVDASGMEVRQIRWNERRDGSKVGSVVVDLSSPELAHRVFDALPCVQTGCGGYEDSPPSCAEGWPDRQGMPRKLVRAPSAPEEFHACEVISYFPMNLRFTRSMRIKTSVIGRLMGPMGRTVLMIQQVCGARIVITQQADKACEDPRFRTAAQIQVAADTQAKVDQAVQMVHSALKRELSVQQKKKA